MRKVVVLNHLGTWYKAYGDSAKIISFLTNYKLFEDVNTRQPSIGFPEQSIVNVVTLLRKNKINYMLKYDEDKVVDFGNENNFDRFLHQDLPFSYIVSDGVVKKEFKGFFKVRYDEEDVEEFIIGENISPDAELVKKIINANVGDIIEVNNFNVLVVEKNIY